MKYFVLSEISASYNWMLAALNEQGFDEENKNHTLVSLGNALTFGNAPSDVLDYLMSLDRKILIIGSLEEKLRGLLLKKRRPDFTDMDDGTMDVLLKLASVYNEIPYTMKDVSDSYDEIIRKALKSGVLRYIDSCSYFHETKGYVFTYSYLPLNEEGKPYIAEDLSMWCHALHMNPLFEAERKNFYKKTIVSGSVPSRLFNLEFLGEDTDYPFISKGITSVNSDVTKGNKMYCIVLEDF